MTYMNYVWLFTFHRPKMELSPLAGCYGWNHWPWFPWDFRGKYTSGVPTLFIKFLPKNKQCPKYNRPFEIVQNRTMWKFSNFPATLNLREINCGWFQKVKNCHSDHFSSSKFWILEIFWHFQVRTFSKNQNSKSSKLCKTAVFDLLKSATIDFT